MSSFDLLKNQLNSYGNSVNLVMEDASFRQKGDHYVLSATYSQIIDGLDRFQRRYLEKCHVYKLPVNAIYEQLLINKRVWALCGWVEENRKYPIIIKDVSSGERIKMHPSTFEKMYMDALKLPA